LCLLYGYVRGSHSPSALRCSMQHAGTTLGLHPLVLVRMVHFNSECLASCGTCTTDCPVHCVCAALACACMLPLRRLVFPTFRPPVFHPVRWCARVIHCACFWLASRILGAAFGAHCMTVRPLWESLVPCTAVPSVCLVCHWLGHAQGEVCS
jgi:hypothetical protein